MGIVATYVREGSNVGTVRTKDAAGFKCKSAHFAARPSGCRAAGAWLDGRAGERYILLNITNWPRTDIESQSLSTCEVAPDGNTVVLDFTDSSGAPARIRLPFSQLGALAMTLPDLINKALQSRYGDHTLRYVYPLVMR
ncbi:MAG: hypothetical protein ABSG88_19525 [Bradyrhizobium sp.]